MDPSVVSTEVLAFVQSCQVAAGAWICDDPVRAFPAIWKCLSCVPLSRTNSDRAAISIAVTQLAVGTIAHARRLGAEASHSAFRNVPRERACELMSLVEKDVDRPDFTLKGCAHQMGLSYHYLSHAFAFACASSCHFRAHVNGIRMLRAAALLAVTSKSIKEIAIDVGYSRPNELNRQFQRRLRMTPSTFRSGTRSHLFRTIVQVRSFEDIVARGARQVAGETPTSSCSRTS